MYVYVVCIYSYTNIISLKIKFLSQISNQI